MNSKFIYLALLLCSAFTKVNAQNVPVVGTDQCIDRTIDGTVGNPVNYPSAYLAPAHYNYTKVLVPHFATLGVDEGLDPPSVSLITSYTDGFGRPMETIERYKSGSKDIITAYDNRPGADKWQFLPYPSTPNLSTFRLSPYTDQAAYYSSKYPDEAGTAGSKWEYLSAPYNRGFQTYSPGKSNIGQWRSTVTTIGANHVNEVPIWRINYTTGALENGGFYEPNKLSATTVRSLDGGFIMTYTDFDGKLIEKITTLSSGDQIETYFVYDFYDRLVYTILPKTVDNFYTGPWPPLSATVQNGCAYKIYDDRGRLVEEHFPEQNGNKKYIYDNHGRVIFTQQPADGSNWFWTLYDRTGRQVETGIYTGSAYSRATIQSWFDNSALPTSLNNIHEIFYFQYNELLQGVYPGDYLNNCEIYSANYYDQYSYTSFFDGSTSHSLIFGYDGSIFEPGTLVTGVGALTPQLSAKTEGKLTFKVSKSFKASAGSLLQDYTISAYYYDKYGNLIEQRTKNPYNGDDISGNQYSFDGRLLVNMTRFNNPLCTATPSTKIKTQYTYWGYNFSLSSICQKIDDNAARIAVSYRPNELGQMKQKILGENIEIQQLTYNIRGQLSGINSKYAETGVVEDPIYFPATFGEDICYDEGFTSVKYGGEISGILWRTAGFPACAYGYKYDDAGRLIQSDYNQYSSAPPLWSPSGWVYSTPFWNHFPVDYTEGGISYDKNGNIKTLQRNGDVSGGYGPVDNLSLSYQNGELGNHLQSVSDAVSSTTTATTDYDFKDRASLSLENEYDDNGNLKIDKNKATTTTYWPFNKPKKILFDNGDYIEYSYDGTTQLVEEVHYDHITSSSKVSNYLGPITYQNNDRDIIYHAEGYAQKDGSEFDYYYFVKDHLGNVRNVLNSKLTTELPAMRPILNTDDPTADPVASVYPAFTDVSTYTATHEVDNAKLEESLFENISKVRGDKPLSQDPNDTKAAILDGADPNRTIGTTLVLKVMAGDAYDVAAQSFYESDFKPNGSLDENQMINAILGSLNDQGGGQSGEGQAAVLGKLFTADNLSIANSLSNNQVDPDVPLAFVNYTVFDENFQIVREESGRVQIHGAPGRWSSLDWDHRVPIGTNGWLVVSITNLSTGTPVAIDPLTVHHYKGTVMEAYLYYPYGLPVNISTSFTSHPENKNLNQTKIQDKTNQLYVHHFGAREYDPQLGKFLSVDPASQFSSGYTGMGNCPSNIVDPTGAQGIFDGASSSTSSGWFWSGIGVSGGGPLGFSMSPDAIASGNKAYQDFFGAATMAAMGLVGGEMLGAMEVPSDAALIGRGMAEFAEYGEVDASILGRLKQDYEAISGLPSETQSAIYRSIAQESGVDVSMLSRAVPPQLRNWYIENWYTNPFAMQDLGAVMNGLPTHAEIEAASAKSMQQTIELINSDVSMTKTGSNQVTLFRNFGEDEYNSIMQTKAFSIGPGYDGKQFWLGESGLNMWTQSPFGKQYTISVNVPASFANPFSPDYIFTESGRELMGGVPHVDGFPGGTVAPGNLNKFNSAMTINWFRY